jgi:hypothetical protein
VDADTSDDQITFVLSNYGSDVGDVGGCGYISLRSRPTLPATRFSQEDVRNGKVMFTHKGETHNLSAPSRADGKLVCGSTEQRINWSMETILIQLE